MKRTIFWLIPIGILCCIVVYYWPQEEITDNAYIDYIKESAYEQTTYEQLMASNCAEQNWVYFQTNRGQDVVEFKGDCTIATEEQPVNLQFLIDEQIQNYSVGAMLIAQEKVEETKRDATLQSFIN